MKISFNYFVVFLIIISTCSSCSILLKSFEKVYDRYADKNNLKIDSISTKLKLQIDGLPFDINNNIIIQGNPKANIVLINAQGGPLTKLNPNETEYMAFIQAKLPKDSILVVDVHQYQTLRPKLFKTKPISFEDAKKYDAQSVKMLAKTISFFKNKEKTIIVLGISFGAFVVEDLIANYPMIADKYIIVVGRLNMPNEVWEEFAKGNYVGFKYKKGVPRVVKFNEFQAGEGGGNSIEDKNTSKLAAGIGYKRFVELLKDKNLNKVSYFYGTKDEQVGRLSSNEIKFLQSKNVQIIKIDKTHTGTIDKFSFKYLNPIFYKLKNK